MALIGVRDLSWGFSDPPLLENISFQIEKGERVGLLGRNGVGKSTLLKLLLGEVLPDSGQVWRQQGVTVAYLSQDVSRDFEGSIFDVVAGGLGPKGRIWPIFGRASKLKVIKKTSFLLLRRMTNNTPWIQRIGGPWLNRLKRFYPGPSFPWRQNSPIFRPG